MHWYIYCRWGNGVQLTSWANSNFNAEFQRYALVYGKPVVCESRCKTPANRLEELV